MNNHVEHFKKQLWASLRLTVLFLLVPAGLAAQCVTNPTGETAVGMKNASSYFVTFYIDEINMGGVPSGDRSIDFRVSPGEHALRAEAVIGGETVSAMRTANIPAGYVCTWTVTDPPKKQGQARPYFLDALPAWRATGFVPLVVPNY